MRSAGFDVTVHDDTAMDARKDRMGIPAAMRSCHTGQIGGYVIEGHVPAADIQRLLKTRPALMGLAIPGMPMSAPGMAQPGARVVPYDVVGFQRSGATKVFAHYK